VRKLIIYIIVFSLGIYSYLGIKYLLKSLPIPKAGQTLEFKGKIAFKRDSTHDYLIGVHAESYEKLYAYCDSLSKTEYAKECGDKYKVMIITLTGRDHFEEKTMTIKTLADIPRHSVRTECPISKYIDKNAKCWYIKYDKE
jgi:hypothetical protein